MAKEIKKITENQFRMLVAVIIVLSIGLVYFAVVENRFRVIEPDGFVENPIISARETLNYDNEFCASKLTDLAHEIHFLEMEISQQESAEEGLNILPEVEGEIIGIEQRELTQVRKDFDTYKELCDTFENDPTSQLCDRFLQEAQDQLGLAQENAKTVEDGGILDRFEFSLSNLRKSKRVYEGLQKKCTILE